MKELTSYNRAAGYLNKLFDLLNQRYFEKRTFKTYHHHPEHPQGIRTFHPP